MRLADFALELVAGRYSHRESNEESMTTPDYDDTETYQDAIDVLEQEVRRRTLAEGRESCRAARRILLSADGRADAPPVGDGNG